MIRQSEKYNPSRLRFRVDIQIERGERDDIGGYNTEWVSVLSRWCDIVPVSAGETFQASQITGDVTHRIHMRVLSQAELTFAAAVLAGYNSHAPLADTQLIASFLPQVYTALVTFTDNPPELVKGIDPNQTDELTAPLYRLVYKGRVLHVTSVRTIANRSEWLEIFAREEN